jgi:hypothetical protein
LRNFYLYAVATATLLSGCAQSAGTLPNAASNATAAKPPAARQAQITLGALPKCRSERHRKNYVQTSTHLKVAGGALCIGAFHGFGGTLEYPSVERPVELTNRITVTNLYNEPELGSGTPLIYLNLHFDKSERFGAIVVTAGGLESKKFVAGQSYTALGQVLVGHLAFRFTPCYTVATSGVHGGLLPNVGAIFDNAIITGNGFGVVEIYQGTQASEECAGTSS